MIKHTPLEQMALQKKYEELEKKADKQNPFTDLQLDETVILHPALDYRQGIALVGFRAQRKNDKGEIVDTNVFLLIKNQNRELLKVTLFEHNETQYSIEAKKHLLALLKEKWTVKGLQAFVLKQSCIEPEEVFSQIRGLIESYCYLSTATDYDLVTAWVIGTYFHRVFFSFPFLHIKAPKGSGKSQLLGLLEKLCFNAVKARPTAASLGDTITSLRATMLLDQADSLHSDNNLELVELLTDSYKSDGGKRRVMDMSKGRKILEFETYSPKAFASTIDLPEDLRDRCILVPLMRSTNQYPTPDDQNEDWFKNRGLLYQMLVHCDSLRVLCGKIRGLYAGHPTLFGRTLDLWLPIESVMSLCRVDQERINNAKELYLNRYSQMMYEPKDHEAEVLKAVLSLLGDEESGAFQVKDITRKVNENRHREAQENLDLDIEDLTTKKVGWVISNFNLASNKKRINKGIIYTFHKKAIITSYQGYFNTYETTQQH